MDAENLLLQLQQSGLTQTEIADEVGCSQPTISGMANGKVGKSRPSYKIIQGLIRLAEQHGLQCIGDAGGNKRRRKDDKQQAKNSGT